MSKVHITLVGGQPAPVYYVIKKLSPAKVVYICSEQTENVANAVCRHIDITDQLIIKLNPTDAGSIQKKVNELASTYQADEVTINISSGPKPWTYFFVTTFEKHQNATILYIDQNNMLWDYTRQTVTDISGTFNLLTTLSLHGNTLTQFHKLAEYDEYDYDVCRKIQKIRQFRSKDFTQLLSPADKEVQREIRDKSIPDGRYRLNSGSYVEWFRATSTSDGFARIYLADIRQEFELESPHAVELAFNSGWFEYKIARMLSRWNKQQNLFINCIFPYNANIDKNEVDIIVETGSKALFVECKTDIFRTTDIDKFKSVVKHYGGMGSMALFITESKMKSYAIEKCAEQNILHLSLKNFKNDSEAENALRRLLDSNYRTINAI